MSEKMVHRISLSHTKMNIALNILSENLMDLVMVTSSNEVKDTLLRIKIDESYNKNAKNLGVSEVGTLKETVTYLRYIERSHINHHLHQVFLCNFAFLTGRLY